MLKFWIIVLLALIAGSSRAQKYQLFSPDQKLAVEVEISPSVQVKLLRNNIEMLKLSGLSLQFKGNVPDFGKLQVKKVTRKSVNEQVKPLVKEKADQYANQYNEMQVAFKSGVAVDFRLFNEGLAYRFSTSVKDSLTILSENLKIQLADGDSIRYQPSGSFNSSYETPYEFKPVGAIGSGKLSHLPALIQKKDGPFVMITEADLYNYPGLWLAGTNSTELIGTNPPFPKKYRYTGSIYEYGQIAETNLSLIHI